MQCSRLLVMESGLQLEDGLKPYLPESDFQITVAKSKENLLELIQSNSYSVAIIMIDSSSQEDISYIQKIQSIAKHLPLIVITSQDNPEEALKLFALKTFAAVKKPTVIELVELIKSAIEIIASDDNLNIISATPSWIEFTIPSQNGYLVRLATFFNAIMVDFPDMESKRLVYAFRELLQNAMEHGNAFNPSKKVFVQYIKTKKFIMFHVEDEGKGFNLDSLPHAAVGCKKNSALEVLQYRKKLGIRPGGLGISTILTIADELIYNQKGNSVFLIKYLEERRKP